MKLLKPLLAIAVLLCCSCSVQAQCTSLAYSQVGDAITPTTVSSINGPITVIASETKTYQVTCKNTNTGATFYTGNNATTAGGTYGWTCPGCDFPCPPEWGLVVIPGDSFTAQSFNATVLKNGTASATCASAATPAQQNTTTCPTTSCGSGGGCPTCPYQRVCQPTCVYSPIILDVTGAGFFLTSAANGVTFDITGTGFPVQIAWTAEGVDNAFLALPGPDGLVHSGKELFGDFTSQPPSGHPNGFAALAVYDQPANGGNGDGIIDSRDAIFSALRLWVDANHDGICQSEELHTLPSLGINSISLKYTEDRKTDQYGNQFRYRARLNPDKTTEAGKIAYDVYFVALTQSASKQHSECLVSSDVLPKQNDKLKK